MLKAPFPWAGGKSTVAASVWQRFGDTLNYCEPFFGSGAVLLARPFPVRVETVNDKDPYVSNFFRALQAAPDEVAYYCDYPVIETDLHARHLWLVNQGDFREKMLADPDYYDSKIAGWWVWGLSAWIGSGWCDIPEYDNTSRTHQKRPDLGKNHTGKGAHSLSTQRPNLRPRQGVEGVPAQIPYLKGSGQGVNSTHQKRPNLPQGDSIRGLRFTGNDLYTYLEALAARLRRVRVCCGDWTRITGKSVTYLIGETAILLDPPYDPKVRSGNLYSVDDNIGGLSTAVREWCIEHIVEYEPGHKDYFSGPRYMHPKLKIALCGYEGEGHEILEEMGWDAMAWKANGGYSNQNKNGNGNKHKERIWFSPNCIPVIPKQPGLALVY